LDNSRKAIGWLNRSKLRSSDAEHDFGVLVLRSSVGRTDVRECTTRGLLRATERSFASLRSKGDRRECLCGSGGVCAALGRSRVAFVRWFEAFLTGRCLDVRHWPDPAGLASAYARDNSVAFNWTGSCVTRDHGVAEDSAHDGSNCRVHGQRSTRHGKRKRTVSIGRRRTGRCRRGAGLHGCGPRRS
jgi:hypothetical protein